MQKWLCRLPASRRGYEAQSYAGLEDLSRAPHPCEESLSSSSASWLWGRKYRLRAVRSSATLRLQSGEVYQQDSVPGSKADASAMRSKQHSAYSSRSKSIPSGHPRVLGSGATPLYGKRVVSGIEENCPQRLLRFSSNHLKWPHVSLAQTHLRTDKGSEFKRRGALTKALHKARIHHTRLPAYALHANRPCRHRLISARGKRLGRSSASGAQQFRPEVRINPYILFQGTSSPTSTDGWILTLEILTDPGLRRGNGKGSFSIGRGFSWPWLPFVQCWMGRA